MRKCELCDSIAKMYCESDQASLCWDCDANVHSANFLVAKHSRTLLCHLCQSRTPWTASGSKLAPTVSVCENCISETRNGVDDQDQEDEETEEEEEAEELEDEDNQVVPWSSSTPDAPPPTSSSSNSGDEGVFESRITFPIKGRRNSRTSFPTIWDSDVYNSKVCTVLITTLVLLSVLAIIAVLVCSSYQLNLQNQSVEEAVLAIEED